MFKKLFLLFSLMTAVIAVMAQDTTQYIIQSRSNGVDQQKKPYVILISADGFRYDFARRYGAENILNFAEGGVEATSMQPSFPTLTFPNHYTIVTGLYPAHHGIVDNRFYDTRTKKYYAINKKHEVQNGSWYGGTPLWVLAEKQKMVSASFFWVGSESDVQSTRPTYYFNYSEAFSFDRRLQILQEWLNLPEEKRPHFITFYFPEVDHAAHRFGVYSEQTRNAVHDIDTVIGKMNDIAKATDLPINFIFVSDHGFTNVDTVNTLQVPQLDTGKFITSAGSTLIHIYAKNKDDVMPLFQQLKQKEKNYTAYLEENVPLRWHYGRKDDKYGRIGDIVMVAHMPYIFYSKGYKNIGVHGFDNAKQEMQATFYAWGPAFKEGLKINNFTNIHIYPMIAHLLGLKYNEEDIDGRFEVLKDVLEP